MLVLTRGAGEGIVIGEGIIIKVLQVRGGKVRFGIDAPRYVSVRREELPVRKPGAQPVCQITHPQDTEV